jgi:hypothetical protein
MVHCPLGQAVYRLCFALHVASHFLPRVLFILLFSIAPHQTLGARPLRPVNMAHLIKTDCGRKRVDKTKLLTLRRS